MSRAQIELTAPQAEAFEALKRGPLYRMRGESGFRALGTRKFREQSIRPLVDMGYANFDPNIGPAGALIIREQG